MFNIYNITKTCYKNCYMLQKMLQKMLHLTKSNELSHNQKSNDFALIAASCLHIVSFRALSTLYIKTHYQRWIVPLQVISMVNVLQILGSNPGWSMVNGL